MYSAYRDTIEEVVLTINICDKIVIMGDFNLPTLDLNAYTSHGDNESTRIMCDLAVSHNLEQVNTVPNYRGVCLDLVLSSLPSSVVTPAEEALLSEDRHHPALSVTVKIQSDSSTSRVKYVPNYRRSNLDAIFQQIQSLQLPVICDSQLSDVAFENFSHILRNMVEQNTPLKRIVSTNFPKWFSPELQRLVIMKKIAHKAFKASCSGTDYNIFARLRAQCKELASKCFDDYTRKVEEYIPTNIKAFWSHVNGLKRAPNIPTEISLDSSFASDPVSKCNLFAQFFASVFKNPVIDVPSFDFKPNITLSSLQISPTDVLEKLTSLDPNKSAGPDGIPPLVLKFCAPVLSIHLAILFNMSLMSGTFPSSLKRGYVVPIYKSGERNNVKNYRPIVIQSTIAKIFESLVLDYLHFHLKNFLSNNQHGFLHGRSTVSNLLVFQEYVMSAFLHHKQVDCLYLDFSKAFDRVHHQLIIAKLSGYGVQGLLLSWLDSYLHNRSLVVKCDGGFSDSFPVLSGVPQGSHLGPLLFNLFINDIATHISSDHLMFADDIKIFTVVQSITDQNGLQVSLNNIVDWCSDNAMDLNISKCQVVSFKRGSSSLIFDYHIHGKYLKRSTSTKDLGVHMSSTLSPLEHITSLTAKASSLLGFINRSTKNFRSPQSLVVLYKHLILPLLEYASPIWTPYQLGHISMLEDIHKRFIRLLGWRLGYDYYDTPILHLETIYALHKPQLRRKHQDLCLLFKLINGLIDCPQLLSSIDISIPRGTRTCSTFRRKFHPTYYTYNSGLSRLMQLGSVAASEIDFFGVSFQSFKGHLRGLPD